MTKSHSDDARSDTITDDLRTVWAGMQQLCVPTWLKLDLTMAQFKALVAVERSAGISVCEVGRELSIGESAASLLVDQLVRRGHVGRTTDPADRRRVRLVVTAPGEELLRELRQGGREILSDWLAELGADDLEALAHGLRALAGTVRASKLPVDRDQATESVEREATTESVKA
jgi:DNA-binding MarR family transcriptional regulator